MSRPVISYWPALSATTAAVAAAQSYVAGIPLKITTNTGGYSNPPQIQWANPTVPTPAQNIAGYLNAFVPNPQANLTSTLYPTGNNGPYFMPGIIRTLNFASVDDLSATTFTVVGWGFPASYITNTSLSSPISVPALALISETVTGPNAAIVETVNAYSQIISITPDTTNALEQVTVGHGNHGMTNWHNLDTDLISWASAAQILHVVPVGSPALNSGGLVSLFDPYIADPKSGNLNYPQDGMFCVPNPAYTNGVIKVSNVTTPFRSMAAYFLDAPLSTASAYFITVQQGLRS